MKQKLGITILCAVMAFVAVSCDSLWKVENKADISFSLSKEALTAMSQSSNVRSIDLDNDIVTATISLLGENGNAVASKPVLLEKDKDASVFFEDLAIIGHNIYAKIEATIDGVKFEGISETKRMITGVNTLHISGMYQLNKDFTITFEANNGTGIKTTQNFIEGVPQTLQKNSFTKTGETFIGWATASGGGVDSVVYADEEEYTATSDKTLYAVWAKPYTLTFNANGGTVDPTSKMVLDGMKIGDLPIPSKANSTFSAWQIDGVSISSDTEYTYGADKEAVASWDTVTYTVTLDTNGGTELDAITAIENTKIAKPADPEKVNASFVGWYKDEALTIEWNFESDVVTSDMTLYADWNDTIYTITFDANGGSGTMQEQTFTSGVAQGLTANLFTPPSGMTFMGWSTTPSGSVEIENSASYTATESKTLYAVWKTLFAVTFDDGNTQYTQEFTDGVAQNLKPFEFAIPSGKGFAGWTTTNGGTTVDYTDEEEYTAIASVTLYPVWVGNITNVTATLSSDGTVLTVTEGGSQQLKAAIHAVVNDTNRPTITKIVIEQPINGGRITPEPDLSRLFYDDSGYDTSYSKLTSIEGLEWIDTSNVTDMNHMFSFCSSLTNLDVSNYNTSQVKDMSAMFSSCTSLTSLDVTNFDTSNVTNIRDILNSCYSLTSIDVSKFDTSKVTDMTGMFSRCWDLESLDISSFDTSSVTSMNLMFYQCKAFTSLDISNFDTSSVTNMNGMFNGCNFLESLTLPESFDTSSVISMSDMFANCEYLESLTLPESFDTSLVINMSYMFADCRALTSLDVSNFDTSNVTYMNDMFANCRALTSLDVSNFDTSLVINMSNMFAYCYNLESLDVSNFNTSSVINTEYMNRMFQYCSKLTELQVPQGVTFVGESAFEGCSALTEVVIPSTVVDIQTNAFYGCTALQTNGVVYTIYEKGSQPLEWEDENAHPELYDATWKTLYTVTFDFDGTDTNTYTQLFYNGDPQNLKPLEFTIPAGKGFAGWSTTNGGTTVAYKDKAEYTASANATLYPVWVGNITNVTATLSSDGTVLTVTEGGSQQLKAAIHAVVNDTNRPTITKIVIEQPSSGGRITPEADLSRLFTDDSGYNSYYLNLTSTEGLEWIDTSSVTDMNNMFYRCSGLTSLDVSGFDTSSVTNMYGMFTYCSSLTSLDVSNFNTSNVTNMNNMFRLCTNLTTLDISSFSTSKVTIMTSMFYDCKNITSLDVSNFDTSNVTNMYGMFYGCSGLTSLDVSSFNTSSVTIMDSMFYGCSGLTSLDLSNFDSSKVTNMNSMFHSCSSLENLDVSSFDTSKVTNMRYMFTHCSSLTSLDVSSFDTSSVIDMIYMFSNCSKLTEVQVPQGATFVGESAFTGCSALTEVVIPSTVTDIQTDAFAGCTALQTVYTTQDKTNPAPGWENASTHPELYDADWQIKYTDESLFTIDASGIITSYTGGTTLTEIFIPPTIKNIAVTGLADAVFLDNAAITSVAIPEGVTSIGNDTFRNCSSLESVSIPNTVSSMGTFALSSTPLHTVTIPSSLATISESAFRNCDELTEITIPNTVISIGEYAFGFSSKLQTITIEDGGILSIEGRAFYDCPALANINFGNSVNSIGSYAFWNCDALTTVTLPSTVATLNAATFFGCNNLSTVTLQEGLKTINNFPFMECTALTSIVIPNSVTSMGNEVFEGCTKLAEITIPSTVTTIGSDAFKSTILSTVYTDANKVSPPSGWADATAHPELYGAVWKTMLTDESFFTVDAGSGVITDFDTSNAPANIVIPSIVGDTTITEIGQDLFFNNYSLASVVISEEITKIGDSAFRGCTNLKTVVIPNSVNFIDGSAFYECTALETITIPDSVTTIGISFQSCNSLTIYTEHATQPPNGYDPGWSGSWNYSTRPVVWGCTLSDGISEAPYVVSVTKGASTIENDTNALNAPYREGYTFSGWSSSEGGSVEPDGADALRTLADETWYAVWSIQ